MEFLFIENKKIRTYSQIKIDAPLLLINRPWYLSESIENIPFSKYGSCYDKGRIKA